MHIASALAVAARRPLQTNTHQSRIGRVSGTDSFHAPSDIANARPWHRKALPGLVLLVVLLLLGLVPVPF
jgi:hypothetical protein